MQDITQQSCIFDQYQRWLTILLDNRQNVIPEILTCCFDKQAMAWYHGAQDEMHWNSAMQVLAALLQVHVEHFLQHNARATPTKPRYITRSITGIMDFHDWAPTGMKRQVLAQFFTVAVSMACNTAVFGPGTLQNLRTHVKKLMSQAARGHIVATWHVGMIARAHELALQYSTINAWPIHECLYFQDAQHMHALLEAWPNAGQRTMIMDIDRVQQLVNLANDLIDLAL